MRHSKSALQHFERYQSEIDDCWEIIRDLQKVKGIEGFLKHPLESKDQLYEAYLEYLWLFERLWHPEEKRFFKPYFLPFNGYLDAYFDLSSEEVTIFEAPYFPNSMGQNGWKKEYIAQNEQELALILDPSFDFDEHYRSRFFSESGGLDPYDFGALFLEQLETGEIAAPITKENLEYSGEKTFLTTSSDSLRIYPVTGLAHVFLPEVSHELSISEYWCERLDDIYVQSLSKDELLPHLKNLNALSLTNRFLATHSDKSYQGIWRSEKYGRVELQYRDRKMIFKGVSRELETLIKGRFERFIAP